MEYIFITMIAIAITTVIVYKLANMLGIQLRLKPLILCAACALLISLVLPRVVVGFVGLAGTFGFLALFAVVFAYFVARYDDSFEPKGTNDSTEDMAVEQVLASTNIASMVHHGIAVRKLFSKQTNQDKSCVEGLNVSVEAVEHDAVAEAGFLHDVSSSSVIEGSLNEIVEVNQCNMDTKEKLETVMPLQESIKNTIIAEGGDAAFDERPTDAVSPTDFQRQDVDGVSRGNTEVVREEPANDLDTVIESIPVDEVFARDESVVGAVEMMDFLDNAAVRNTEETEIGLETPQPKEESEKQICETDDEDNMQKGKVMHVVQELESNELPDNFDELFDYAFRQKEQKNYIVALLALRKLVDLYPDNASAPFVVIEMGGILKNRGAYDEAIKVFSEGRNLAVLQQDNMLKQEFVNTVAYLRIIKNVLLENRLGLIPFNAIPDSVMKEIETEFQEWRDLA